MRGIACLIVGLALLGFAPSAHAQSYCQQTAAGWSDEDQTGATANKIHIFIESDFATGANEFRDTTPDTDDSTVTEEQLRNAIVTAAEIWNTQTRGQALVYEGPLGANDSDEACYYLATRPALFVHFDRDESSGDALASVRQVDDIFGQDCPKMRELVVWGENDGSAIDWNFGSQEPDGVSLVNVLVHEFGHVLQLDHQDQECYSVMHKNHVNGTCCVDPLPSGKNCGDPGTVTGGRYPMWGDKECVTAYTNPRNARYVRREFEDTGAVYDSYLMAPTSKNTERGYLSGGHVFHDKASQTPKIRYVLYNDATLWSAKVGWDGDLQFWHSHVPPWSDDVNELPVFFRPLEKTDSTYSTVFNFLKDARDGYSPDREPPWAAYRRSDDMFEGTNMGWHYTACVTSNCYDDSPLETYVPVTAAWDPETENTMFAVVRGDSVGNSDGGGLISIHPGYHSNDTLRSGNELIPADALFPADGSSQYDYVGRTDFPAAVSCADSGFGFSYNCMLAWNDKGVRDGMILFTYFRYDESNDEVEFYEINDIIVVARVESSHTNSAPSMGFFADQFWISWKHHDVPVKMAYRTDDGSSGYFHWDNSTSFTQISEPYALDPPTFLYYQVPGDAREGALSWTKAE